jgi:hypothetical protein
MVGQESSAKAPEKLSNSNSFLHKKKIPALRHSYNLEAERKHNILPTPQQNHILVVVNRNSPLFIVKSNITWL